MISLLAKLEKADRAFCFTSGMAALAAVTHLLEAGSILPHLVLVLDLQSMTPLLLLLMANSGIRR